MSNVEIIQNKISTIQKYLALLKGLRFSSVEEITKDQTLLAAAERYAYLAVQATIDLAEAYIAFNNLRKASTMSENFEILAEYQVLEKELAENLTKMVGFRNILAHDYEKLDYSILLSVITEKTDDIEKFILIIEEKLN